MGRMKKGEVLWSEMSAESICNLQGRGFCCLLWGEPGRGARTGSVFLGGVFRVWRSRDLTIGRSSGRSSQRAASDPSNSRRPACAPRLSAAHPCPGVLRSLSRVEAPPIRAVLWKLHTGDVRLMSSDQTRIIYPVIEKDAFFDILAHGVLVGLSVLGFAALLPCLGGIAPESLDGERTPAGGQLARARALLILGCTIIWGCTALGYLLWRPPLFLPFGFWRDHKVALQRISLFIDAAFVVSVVVVWKARGKGKQILLSAALAMAAASILGSVLFWS